MKYVLQMSYRMDGNTSEMGKYVVHYDPTLIDGIFTLKLTSDIKKAKQFDTAGEALEYWQQICPNHPMRSDGKPNRPLTAWYVEIVEK